MIDKQKGNYLLVCDICGEEAGKHFDDFYDAVEHKKENGWKGFKKNKTEWLDICPECQESEVVKMKKLEQAIAYFEDAIRESDEIIAECSGELQKQLTEQKAHFEVALETMKRQKCTRSDRVD